MFSGHILRNPLTPKPRRAKKRPHARPVLPGPAAAERRLSARRDSFPAMATVGRVQKQISKVEGFRVRFLHLRDGRDVRDDMEGVAAYPYELAAKGSMTVEDWERGRFRSYYDFGVRVLRGDGRTPARGNMRLDNLRAEYPR
jgi:hypothetical protein